MTHFATIPPELVAALGTAASDKLVDLLNSSFSVQKEDLVAMSGIQFENRLTGEITGVRLEIADLRTEVADLRAEVRTEIAGLRTEMRTEIAEMRTEIADLRTEMRTEIARTHTHIEELRSEMKADFVSVHKEISAQTKWILAGLAAAVTLYPVLSRVMLRLIP